MDHIAHLRKHKVDWKENKPIIYCMRIKWFSNWTNLISLHPRMLLCQIWLKSAQRFWRRSLLYFVNIFLLLNNYPPWKKGGALLLNKLDSHHPRMLCAKFGWNWRNGLGEEDFWFLFMYFCDFVIIFLGKGRGPSFEQTWIPFSQKCTVLSLVEICQLFWRRRLLYFVCVFLLLNNYLPLEKRGPSFDYIFKSF